MVKKNQMKGVVSWTFWVLPIALDALGHYQNTVSAEVPEESNPILHLNLHYPSSSMSAMVYVYHTFSI